MTTLPLATVQDRLSSLVDEVARTHDAVTITRDGTPTAVVLSVEDYESIMETLDLLNDPVDQERLVEAAESLATGDVTSGEEMGELVARRLR
ncbi:MAG: type II toxin-antitoxin system Phd/YefM family antitoxin [Dermatophilaceae bacterium]